MKNFRLCTVTVLFALILAVPGFASSLSEENQAQAVSEIEATLQNLLAAADARDAEALSTYYAPNATFVDSSGITVGWDIYREKNLSAQFESLRDDKVPAHVVTSILTSMLKADTAFTIFTFTMDAKVGNLFGTGTIVFQQIDGSWKAVHVQSSARLLEPNEVPPTIRARAPKSAE